MEKADNFLEPVANNFGIKLLLKLTRNNFPQSSLQSWQFDEECYSSDVDHVCNVGRNMQWVVNLKFQYPSSFVLWHTCNYVSDNFLQTWKTGAQKTLRSQPSFYPPNIQHDIKDSFISTVPRQRTGRHSKWISITGRDKDSFPQLPERLWVTPGPLLKVFWSPFRWSKPFTGQAPTVRTDINFYVRHLNPAVAADGRIYFHFKLPSFMS
jgi:hypothetical protein